MTGFSIVCIDLGQDKKQVQLDCTVKCKSSWCVDILLGFKITSTNKLVCTSSLGCSDTDFDGVDVFEGPEM